MDIAEEILRKYDEVFNNLPRKGKGNLRFGRSIVSVSNIAEQYYCEQKLDLESEHPVPPTEQMIKEEEGHEAALVSFLLPPPIAVIWNNQLGNQRLPS